MKNIKITPGDFFSISLDENLYSIGQLLLIPEMGMPKCLCSFYNISFNRMPELGDLRKLKKKDIISVLFVTPDLLERGKWPIFGNVIPVGIELRTDLSGLINNNYIGTKTIGSAIVRKFLQAWNGLAIWNDWYNPNYLDGLLLPGVKRPDNIKLK